MPRTIILFVITIMIVIWASVISTRLWSGEIEQLPDDITVTIGSDMTVAQFGQKYNLSNPVLKQIFNLTSPADLKKPVLDFEMSPEQLNRKVNQAMAIQAEHASKDWFKIFLKGILWIIFLFIAFSLLRKGN